MISNYIVPSVFLLIVIICGIVGMKKGFVKQLAGMVSFIISALLAYIFCDPLANVIQKMPFVQTMITDVEMPDFSGTTSLWDKIQTVLTYAAKAFNENGEVSAQANQVMNNYMALAFSYIMAFLVIFFVTKLVIALIALIVTGILKKSPLNPVNVVLGVVLGVVEGFMITWLLSHFFASTILPWLSSSYPNAFSMELADTVYYKIFMNFNPVSLILNLFMG
jgi:uncharacterized membrane protein required for colicin V production